MRRVDGTDRTCLCWETMGWGLEVESWRACRVPVSFKLGSNHVPILTNKKMSRCAPLASLSMVPLLLPFCDCGLVSRYGWQHSLQSVLYLLKLLVVCSWKAWKGSMLAVTVQSVQRTSTIVRASTTTTTCQKRHLPQPPTRRQKMNHPRRLLFY